MQQPDRQADSRGMLTVMFALTLVGFGLKAGIMPLHVWLPGAHAMAPSLGQGACQAIVDALALTRACARGSVADALVAYDAAQRPVGARLVRRSRLLLRFQLSPSLAGARDAALRITRGFAPR